MGEERKIYGTLGKLGVCMPAGGYIAVTDFHRWLCKDIAISDYPVPLGKVTKEILMSGKHDDNAHLRVVVMEFADGPHQNRHASHRQELLGNISTHPQTFPSRHDDNVFLHSVNIDVMDKQKSHPD